MRLVIGELGAQQLLVRGAELGLFLSTIVNKVDRKGRVSVPASFRSLLAEQNLTGIVLYRSFTLPCIEGCGMDHMERLVNSTQELDAFSTEQEDLTALIFADSRQLPWDPEGRIMLPEDFMAHANIGESAAFVGKGKTFQIWEPQAFALVMEETRNRAQQSRPRLPMVPSKPSRTPQGGES